jgi:ribosome-associated heat shock protein Hsp15
MVGRDEPADDRLRIDRWLWCVRLFKTRTAAADAVRAGHVRLNGQRIKPARSVTIGDTLTVQHDETERVVTIAAIPARRGPAPEAVACYVETVESVERRRVAAEQRALWHVLRPPTVGRPDKRTRRLLVRARQRDTTSEE